MVWIARFRRWWDEATYQDDRKQVHSGNGLPLYAWYADCFYRTDRSFLKRD